MRPACAVSKLRSDGNHCQWALRYCLGYGIYFTREETVLTMAKADGSGLRVRVASANPRATITGVDDPPSKANYLMGQSPEQCRTGGPNFGKVMYREILPGIDLIDYGRDHRLEYDFRGAPHANPKAIEMLTAGKEWSPTLLRRETWISPLLGRWPTRSLPRADGSDSAKPGAAAWPSMYSSHISGCRPPAIPSPGAAIPKATFGLRVESRYAGLGLHIDEEASLQDCR